MKRYRSTVLVAGILMLVAGCDKSAEPRPNAEVAKGELMPVGSPGYEPIYVVNQSNIKLVPAPDMSYDSLDGFRSDNAAKYQRMLDRYRAVNRVEYNESADDDVDSSDGEGGGYLNAEEVDRLRGQDEDGSGDESNTSEEQVTDNDEDNDDDDDLSEDDEEDDDDDDDDDDEDDLDDDDDDDDEEEDEDEDES